MSRLLEKSLARKYIAALLGMWVLAAYGCGIFQRADEEWAIGGMIQIRKAEESFKAAKGRYGSLEELRSAGFSAPSREQYGYQFTVRATAASYVAVAVAIRSKDISMSLYLDQSGVLRGKHKNGIEANSDDPPLKGYGDNP